MTKKRIIAGVFCALMALAGVLQLVRGAENSPVSAALTLLFAGLTFVCFRPRKTSVARDEQDTAYNVTFVGTYVGADSSDADQAALHKQNFYSHMGTLEGFSKQDIERIYSMLAGTGEGIGGTAVRYSVEAVVDAEFADRKWTWPELDEWEKIFRQEGDFPSGWNGWWNAPDMESLDVAALCAMLTVDKLRALLDSLGLSYPAKSKKADLAALLEEKANIQAVSRAMPEWESMGLERKRERSKARARELFRLIDSRTGNRNMAQVFASRGRKTHLVIESPKDEVYVKKALALNADAVPPFFPGDRSRYSS